MSVWPWISLGLALALLVYLVYALLKAEDFA
jgi:K+-transporting ATPase KdpF subunit